MTKLIEEIVSELEAARDNHEFESLTRMRQLYAVAAQLGLNCDEIRPSELHENIRDAISSLRAELEAARATSKEYMDATDSWIACGDNDDPSSGKCGTCRACLLDKVEQLTAENAELNRYTAALIEGGDYFKDTIAALESSLAALKLRAEAAEKAEKALELSRLANQSYRSDIEKLRGDEAQARFRAEAAEKEKEAATTGAVDFFKSCLCDKHGEEVKAMGFYEYLESKYKTCHGCEIDRAEAAEKAPTELADLKARKS